MRKKEVRARSDGSKCRNIVNRDRLKPRSGTAMGDGDGRNRPQMADDDANDSQALTDGDIERIKK